MARPKKFDDEGVVLDRAIDLFWKNGVDAVSVRDLEAALELRAPSIYRRFHSKEELLVCCIDRYVDREVAGRIHYFLNEAADPLDGLRAFFTSALRPHPGEQGLRGCLLTTTSGHDEALTPAIRAALDRGFAVIEQAFGEQLQRAKTAGQLDADVDVTAAATALSMSFQGLLVLARSGANDLPAGIDATFRTLAGPA